MVPAVALPPEPLVGRADIHCSASSLGDAAAVADGVRVRTAAAATSVTRGEIWKVKVVVAVFW